MAPKDLIKSDRNSPQLPEGQLVWIPPGFMLSTESPQSEPESHLWDYIWMVWRKRWLVVLMFLLCVSLAALKNYQSIPIYQSAARMKIESDENKIISFQGEQMSLETGNKTEFINTQMQVIQGRQLALQVMDKLGFYKAEPAANNQTTTTQAQPATADEKPVAKPAPSDEKPASEIGRVWIEFKKLVGLAPDIRPQFEHMNGADDKESRDIIQQMMINGFLGGLKVVQLPETNIVSISYTSADPRLCSKVVNTLCDEYIKWTFSSKFESYNYARDFLKEKLEEMKGKLEKSENDLLALTGGKDFIGASADGQLPQGLENYRQKIIDAERQIFEKQFELQKYTMGKGYAALQSLNDTHLNALLQKYSDDQIQYDMLTTQLGPGSQEVRKLKAEMKRIESQLTEALDQATKKAQFDFDQLKANRDNMQKMFDAEKDRVSGIQKNMIQFNILKREVETNRELYNALLSRWKEVGVTSGVKAGYASIIEPALPPMAPSFPNKQRTLLMGALIGVFLGIGLVFFLDYMDTSVKDPEELERIARLPILGFVSHCMVRRNRGENKVSVELLTHIRPRSEFAESIRSIRTSIQYSRAGGAPKTIMVTSCLPGEGKTTIATNLAIALANRNKSVLLIDGDLKKPSLHKLFNVDRKLGLAEVLTGKFDGGNLPETEIKNLSVMPSGAKVPNPVELLDSDVMRKFLESAIKEFDHVVIDTAPSLNMADSAVLAPYVDGVILVVQPGKTPREAVRRVKERLTDVQGNILGLVVNNPIKGADTRYGQRYGYGYGYGKKYGYGEWKDHGLDRGFRGADDEPDIPVKEIVDISIAARHIDTTDADDYPQEGRRQS